MAQLVLDRLQRRFGSAILESHAQHGNETATVDASQLIDIAKFLRDDPELLFDMPVDATCVDWLDRRETRFEAVWHLYSTRRKHRIRLKVDTDMDGQGNNPSVPSLTPIWAGMNWHEREAWDLYGVRFEGHPNLKRVLMYEEFVGHPLRKDYPITRRQPLMELQAVGETPTQRNPPREMLNRP